MNSSAIKKIKDFKTLAHFLAEELNWPIDPDNVDVEDLVFDYSPEDIGLSEEFATKVKFIKQIRPLDSNQPWSVFWIDFENKKLPLTVLRRILNVFVTKKRGNSRNLATKELEDIMFVSGHGEDTNRAITFAHFKRLDDVETIREFYWDGHETKFDHIANYLEKLEWPVNTTDVSAWREKWKSAFTGSTREAISTSDQLAKAMANIARNIRDRVLEVLSVEHEEGPVHKLFDTFKSGLVHDMTEVGFADMYAQTITYGLFSARTMDTDGHFELHEVIDLIPSTNPFLKSLFKECLKTGDNKHKIDLDELGVGSLVDLFDNLNRSDGTDAMQRILAEFGRQTFSGQEDPVIHFYEGFLCEYDSKQRVEKGVYYTPDPVVSFIVRSINEQLKSEFGLEMGLADTTTWSEMVASGRAEYPVDPMTGKTNKEWIDKIKMRAFVQILDPATGTGTFLKHTIEIIHQEVKAKHKHDRIQTTWLDYWNDYVYKSLLPRIYGFELMMASYSVAHMKIGMYLKSLGYKFEKEQRLNIFLTNSLEPFTANNSANLFFTSVGAESAGANDVKQNRYFSVVIGNPPYSISSTNKGVWILNLIKDYKQDLNERKINLDDDYIKFIRFSQNLIDKNRLGIVSFISNNSFIDGVTHRQMRKSLSDTFDKIIILDLHGNSRKKETCPDGEVDNNVFDIMQGVSINFFVKNSCSNKKESISIFQFDLQGKRQMKYEFLKNNRLENIKWNNLNLIPPYYFFVSKNFNNNEDYESGFKITELFLKYSAGIKTKIDHIATDFDSLALTDRIENIISNRLSIEEIRQTYGLSDRTTWEYRPANNLTFNLQKICLYEYRPFDYRYTYYEDKFLSRSRSEVMNNFYSNNNIGLECSRNGNFVFIGKNISDEHFISDNSFKFPLLIHKKNQYQIDNEQNDYSNFNLNIITDLVKKIECTYVLNSKENDNDISAIDILDYIYSVLHSPTYRDKYKEFLKIDFPRVPYPKDKETFWELVKLGSEIRQIHLLESAVVDNFITQYPIIGDNIINKKANFEDGKVWINNTQYFENVPQVAWEFYIGGYQPAQKWLKDRKDRELSEEDINHYQKIIVALTETDRLMKEIDEIEIE